MIRSQLRNAVLGASIAFASTVPYAAMAEGLKIPENAIGRQEEPGSIRFYNHINKPEFSGQKQAQARTIIRDRLYEDQLKRAYIKNPDVFRAHQAALRSEAEARQMREKIAGNINTKDALRRIPGISFGAGVSVDVGGFVRENLVLDFDKVEAAKNNNLRRQLLNDPRELERVAKLIREKMYSGDNDYIKDTVNFTKDMGAGVPEAVDLEALELSDPDLASAYRRLGLDKMSPDQIVSYFSKQMTAVEYKNITNIDINVLIQQNLPVQVKEDPRRLSGLSLDLLYSEEEQRKFQEDDLLKEIDESLAGVTGRLENNALSEAERIELTKTQDQLNKRKGDLTKKRELRAHEATVNSRRAELAAFTSVLNFIAPEEAAKISTVGQSALDIYDAANTMLINGLMSPAGIASMANGVSAIMSVFGNTPSADTLILEGINKLLEGQREILNKLNDIEFKIDRLQAHVDFMIDQMERNHTEVRINLDEIKTKLTVIQYDVVSNRDFTRELIQQNTFENLRQEIAGAREPFANREGSIRWNEIMACRRDFNTCTESAKRANEKVLETLGEIAYFAMNRLMNELAFNDKTDVASMDKAKIDSTMNNVTPTDRLGMLPFMADWLNKHRGVGNVADNAYISKLAIENIPHSEYFNILIQEYVELALALPQERAPDKNIGRLAVVHDDIDNAAKELRAGSPMALDVYKIYFDTSIKAINDTIKAYAPTLPEATEGDGKNRILYFGLSDGEIKNAVSQLSRNDFMALGERLGTFRKDGTRVQEKYRWSEHSHGNVYYIDEKDVDYTIRFLKISDSSKNILKENFQFKDQDLSRSFEYYKKGHDKEGSHSSTTTSIFNIRNEIYSGDYAEINSRDFLNDVLFSSIKYTHAELVDSLQREFLGSNFAPVSTELARANLVLDTIIRSSYGTCVDYDPQFQELGALLKTTNAVTQNIVSGFQGVETTYDLKVAMDNMKDFVSRAAIPKLPESGQNCTYGFENRNIGKSYLALAKQYPDLKY